MTESSDEKRYDSEARIDELLNSYIDGELTVDQQAEVEELRARDEGIAQRLSQFQKCQTLIGALPPRGGAPSGPRGCQDCHRRESSFRRKDSEKIPARPSRSRRGRNDRYRRGDDNGDAINDFTGTTRFREIQRQRPGSA